MSKNQISAARRGVRLLLLTALLHLPACAYQGHKQAASLRQTMTLCAHMKDQQHAHRLLATAADRAFAPVLWSPASFSKTIAASGSGTCPYPVAVAN